MNSEHATPEVIHALADIEMQRQKKEKESGVPVSCSWALRKLHELLPHDRKSWRANVRPAVTLADIRAATLAMGRLRKLSQATGYRATAKSSAAAKAKVAARESAGNRR